MGTEANSGALGVCEATAISRPRPIRREPVVLIFGLALLLAAAYLFSCLRTGWLPQDDGTLAQMGARVLQGELPHRDFVENYTGALSYVHAAALRIFGLNLFSLRICLFLFFLAWLPALAFVAYRYVPAIPAAAVTLLAAVWSVPNYPSSMPSWYNLFFATFGAAALLRYLEAGRRRWLFVAGLCGGASFLIKVTGLYYVAAVLLFLIYREQQLAASDGDRARRSPVYSIFVTVGLLAFLAALVAMMQHRLDDRELIHYVLPSGCLVAMLIWRSANVRHAGDRARFAALFGMGAPFFAGVVAPVALFLVPYALSGSLPAFWHGVFGNGLAAAKGLSRLRPMPTAWMWCVIPLLLLVGTALWRRAATRIVSIVVLAGLLLLLLVYSRSVWTGIWCSFDFLMPMIVATGAAVLIFRPRCADQLTPLREQQLMLVLALAALCNVISFPFAAPIYLCYALPTTILAATALVSTRRIANKAILAGLIVFYAVFAVWRVEPTAIYENWMFVPVAPRSELKLERAGGLRIESAETYEYAINFVKEHATDGTVVATPEASEVYFLSGLHNPTKNDLALSSEELLRALRTEGVRVVVINMRSTFSGGSLTPEVGRAIAARFPNVARLDRYWVFWRND